MFNSSLATNKTLWYIPIVKVPFKVNLSPPILKTTSYQLHRLLRVNVSHIFSKTPFKNLRLIQITSAAVRNKDIEICLHVSAHDCQQMIYALFYLTKVSSLNSVSLFYFYFYFFTNSTCRMASFFCCGLEHLQVRELSGLKSNPCRKSKVTAVCSALKQGLFVTDAQVIRGQCQSGSPQHQKGRALEHAEIAQCKRNKILDWTIQWSSKVKMLAFF